MRSKPTLILFLILIVSIITFIIESQNLSEQALAKLPDTVLVLTWSKLSHHEGAKKQIDLSPYNLNCQLGRTCPSFFWNDVKECSVPCEFTTDKTRFKEADVILFHPDDKFKPAAVDFEVQPKAFPTQLYTVFGHEPVWQRPHVWLNPEWTGVFDTTFHWGLNADVPTNFYYLDEAHFGEEPGKWWLTRTDAERWRSLLPKMMMRSRGRMVGGFSDGDKVDADSCLVSAMVRNCASKERKEFLVEFMSLIMTASYGKCLNTAEGDGRHVENDESEDWDTRSLMDSKVEIISKHPFHLAMESTRGEAGWVTEKIFQSFLAGTVPIYFGNTRDVIDIVPSHSFIDASAFATATDLAEYLLQVASDIELYMSYHAWRYTKEADTKFNYLRSHGRMNSPCALCEYAAQKRAENPNPPPPRGLVYTREDGWERVDTLEKFRQFEQRHTQMVKGVLVNGWFDLFNTEALNNTNRAKSFAYHSSRLFPTASVAQLTSTETRFEEWTRRTSQDTLIDQYRKRGITKV